MTPTPNPEDQIIAALLASANRPKPNLNNTAAMTIPSDAEEAAAHVLARLNDPNGGVSAEAAYKVLAARNAALLAAPKAEIKKALATQITLMEAVTARYLSMAASVPKADHAAAYSKIALSAHRCLISALGALNQLDEQARNAEALVA